MRSSAGIRGNTAQAGPEWAGLEGVACTVEAGEGTFCVSGELGGHPWRVERAPASRDYLVGEELRGRAEIAINGHVTVVIMNRALKEMLEKRAYSLYTDTLETQASPVLTEEMRWLALYPEAGWDSLSDAFFHRYAILAERRADAMAWLTPELVELLMGWPEPAPDNTVPFILMLMRGKAHLRMQALPHAAVADLPAQIHAVRLLVNASGVAVAAFPDVAPGSVKK
ncbi:hypothetical protein [Polaromonas sp.]|uniref:hypothetical protein n=1 Tax=Polaromonas sp. TaxID=1869339 RepID=UPI002CFA1847|nr:hypothetical protein [Polaromonas sp.]HQS31326.1 hypothetical protein [Polaromonas sp.]HQS90256.1 hypothetical protein [Polaromonas sp.]